MDKMNNTDKHNIETINIHVSTDFKNQMVKKYEKKEQTNKVGLENRIFNFNLELEKFKKLEKQEKNKIENKESKKDIDKCPIFKNLVTFFENLSTPTNKKINIDNEKKTTKIGFNRRNDLIKDKYDLLKNNKDAKPFAKPIENEKNYILKNKSNNISKSDHFNADLNILCKQKINYAKKSCKLNFVNARYRKVQSTINNFYKTTNEVEQIISNKKKNYKNSLMHEKIDGFANRNNMKINIPPFSNLFKAPHCLKKVALYNILKDSKKIGDIKYIKNIGMCNFCLLLIIFENLCSENPIFDFLPINLKKIGNPLKNPVLSERYYDYEEIRKIYEKF